MALFAHIAAPQVRLTRDPNTFFFFLDHLEQVSPFRLEDDTTWDTNIELGIAWGMRLIEKDTELYGKSPNAKAFVLRHRRPVVERRGGARAEDRAHQRRPGVRRRRRHDASAGSIPEPPRKPNDTSPREPPIHSSLDRASLREIANAGGGEYLELDREGDREIANRIIDAARRRAGSRGLQVENEELYWRCLLAAAASHVRRAAVPAGARGALAAGGRRGRRARAGVDADALDVLKEREDPLRPQPQSWRLVTCGRSCASGGSHNHAAPRTPLESPCCARTSLVATRSEKTCGVHRRGTDSVSRPMFDSPRPAR